MKNRIIALLCAVTMMLSLTSFAQTDAQKTASYDEDKYELLLSLGIIDKSLMPEDAPNKAITRSEMATFVARMLGADTNTLSYTGTYSDVSAETANSGAITFVTNQGIMMGKGDGCFYPDDTMLWEEAVKTLVYALGYGPFSGNWPDGIMAKGITIGLLKSVSVKTGQPIMRTDALKLLYNALDVDLMEQVGFTSGNTEYVVSEDCTVLSKYLNVSIGRGVVTKNQSTGLTNANGLDADYVEIDGEMFYTGKTNVNKFLGYRVEYYCKEENAAGDMETLLYVSAEDFNEVLIIEAADIGTYDNFSLSYLDNNKTRTVSFTNKTDVIYNYNPASLAKKYLEISDGNLKLIDNNRDGKYDVVISEEFTTLVVSKVDYDNEKIYNKYPNATRDNHLSYASADVFFYDAQGYSLSAVEITEWDVISVMRSEDGSKIYAYVTINEISGTVEAKSDDDGVVYTVNGRDYKVIGDVENYEQIELGRKYIFYLDYLGRIAAVRDLYGDGFRLGYVIANGLDGSMRKTAQIKLLDEEGEIRTLSCAEKTVIDNTPDKSAESINSKLSALCDKVIKYKTNKDGLLCEIETAGGTTIAQNVSAQTLNYRANARVFEGNAILDGETVIFRIPDSGEDDKYYVGDINSAIFSNDVNYTIDSYVLENRLASAAIVSRYSTVATDDAAIGYTAPFMIIDKITYTRDENGEFLPTICGISQTAYRELKVSKSSVLDGIARNDGQDATGITLTKGDIIRYALDVNGNVNGIQLMYRAKNKTYCSLNNVNDSYNRGLRLFEGIVYDTDGANFHVAKTTDVSQIETAAKELQGTNGGFVVIFDSGLGNGGEMFVAGVSDMRSYEETATSADRVFICTTSGHPRAVYIIR